MSHVESVGMPALMGSALEGAKAVSGAFVAVGFSNGAGTAQWVAANRPEGDPSHEPEADDMLRADLESAGAELEIFRYLVGEVG